MKMKKLSVVLLSLLAAVMVLSGCGGGAQDNDSAESAENGAKNSDQAILVVSFGTSYNDSRDKTIGAIETAAAEAFPEYEVRRAFTSQIIIDKFKERNFRSKRKERTISRIYYNKSYWTRVQSV